LFSRSRLHLFLCFGYYPCFYLFFFFQAEDGIRDRNVTGVQTCALPISSVLSNGTKLSGNCPTFDNACDDKRHISTSCGESESLESIANDVPILSCNISIW